MVNTTVNKAEAYEKWQVKNKYHDVYPLPKLIQSSIWNDNIYGPSDPVFLLPRKS